MAYKTAQVGDLIGRVLKKVANNQNEIDFKADNGDLFRMLHFQDCCENVRVEEIIGDLDDLIGSPILVAEERSSRLTEDEDDIDDLSWGTGTWTFYELATIKGSVTIRWLGTSNGYYSERVDFVLVTGKKSSSRIRIH